LGDVQQTEDLGDGHGGSGDRVCRHIVVPGGGALWSLLADSAKRRFDPKQRKGRQTDREFKQFLYIARGSLFEMRTQLELSRRLGYLKNPNDLKAKIKELESMLNSLISKL
jgi:hypothetical protein